MNNINPKNTDEIINDLNCNYGKIINAFFTNHSEGILKFAESISKCHKKLSLFENPDDLIQSKIDVVGFVFLVVDNVYTSVKLLTLGYFVPSGNIMRQSIESMFMALLLSHREKLNIGSERKPNEADFFQHYLKGSKETLSHNSFRHVQRNKDALGVNDKALDAFKKNRRFYSNLSHPNHLTLSSRIVSEEGGTFLIGGGYDENKKAVYDEQLNDRIKYTSIIPNFLDVIYSKIK